MKIRQGFVSNSSTSSFCIFFDEANLAEIDDPNIMVMSEPDEYGTVVRFRPNEEMRVWIKANGLPRKLQLKRVYQYFEGDERTDENAECFVPSLIAALPRRKVQVMLGREEWSYPESCHVSR
jgi:hypothetical protein